MGNGTTIRAFLGKGPLPGYDLERTFPHSFLSGLERGIHKLTYILQGPSGHRSNLRWEYWLVD